MSCSEKELENARSVLEMCRQDSSTGSTPEIALGSADALRLLSGSMSSPDGVVALLGSGISTYTATSPPAGRRASVPAGQQVTAALCEMLSDVDTHCYVRALISTAAFEHVLDACPNKARLDYNLAAIYGNLEPNAYHHAFANLVVDGRLRHIITTNYDEGIERAADMRQAGFLTVITRETQYDAWDKRSPVLFKIHGCAKLGGIVRSLEQEGEMPQWQREALSHVLGTSALLVSGYSGLDFEICPELSQRPNRVLWNTYAGVAGLSSNAQRVIAATAGVALRGGFDELLEGLTIAVGGRPTATSFRPARGTTPCDPEEIYRGMTPIEIALWRLTLVAQIGCADEAIRIGTNLKGDTSLLSGPPEWRVDAIHGLAQGEFHSGRYRRAARHFAEARALAKLLPHPRRYVGATLGQIDAERCAGLLMRPWLRLLRLTRSYPGTAGSGLHGSIELKRVLFGGQFYRLASRARLTGAQRVLQKRSARVLARVADEMAKRGRWFDLQQAEMWARRQGIDLAAICSTPMKPMASRSGFRQIGYFIAELMALRDEITLGMWDRTLPARIVPCVQVAKSLGAFPEAYKLVRAACERGVAVDPVLVRNAEGWSAACEYGKVARALRRWAHG